MLDSIAYPLTFPKYSSVRKLEGNGNYAIRKYYVYPWRYFYRHKVRMIERMLRDSRFNSIMDFGAGPELMTPQWKKYAHEVYCIDKHHTQWPKVNMTICASVMEFVPLKETFEKLSQHTNEIIVASPMQTSRSDFYFKFINDKNKRHSQKEILDEMNRCFSIYSYATWMGLYFCVRGIRK